MINVAEVLNNYPPLVDALARLKAEVEEAEQQVKVEQQQLADLRKQMELNAVGTEQREQLETEAMRLQERLNVGVQVKKRGFVQRESQAYMAAYEAMQAEVALYAAEQKITLVMRTNSPDVNRNDPQAVLKLLNQSLVWSDGRCDCTRVIRDRLQAKANLAPSAPPTAPTPSKSSPSPPASTLGALTAE